MKISDTKLFRVSKIVQKKKFVKDILQNIAQSSGRALLVGGAVRDLFLDVPMQDLDFEVYGLTLEQLQTILEQYGPVSLVGKSFGVLRLHGLDVDWSLPRKDSCGRHPVVQYDSLMSYKQAFIRRDLTINAMGIDMQSFELIDPYHGLQDIERQILRAPDLDFFAQDSLRLLRVMQFAARFAMSVDERLSAACAAMDMSLVSKERIEQEFLKLFLQASKPSIGLRWLVQIGKFHEFLPGVQISDLLFDQVDAAAAQSYHSDHEKLVVIWAVVASHLEHLVIPQLGYVTSQDKQQVMQLIKRITQHDEFLQQIADVVMYGMMNLSQASHAQIRWLACWLSQHKISICLLTQFQAVRCCPQQAEQLFQQALALQVADNAQPAILSGKDFLDVASGVQVGQLVKQAYQIQMDEAVLDPIELKRRAISSLQ